MINKKNVLGKAPFDLGEKDAIHVGIVSVRAGAPIHPGQKCSLNDRREAVPNSDGIGVADPFLKSKIAKGQNFWLLISQDKIPNVRHTWELPNVDFSAPTVAVQKNKWLERHAKELHITYEQLMDACAEAVNTWKGVPYPGDLTEEQFEDVYDKYDIFSEWADEVDYKFDNVGTMCCPEYEYPDVLFTFNT